MDIQNRLLKVQKEMAATTSRVRLNDSQSSSNSDRSSGPPRRRGSPNLTYINPNLLSDSSRGQPWRQKDFKYGNGILGLHQEIEQFYAHMLPTPLENAARLEVISRIESLIVKLFPHSSVEVYGSFRTALYLPTSDIDMVVIGDWTHLPLRMLENEFIMNFIADPYTIKVLDKASVPIIKLTDKRTQIKVDISFNMKAGIQTAKMIREYKRQYPVLPKLVMVLKQFLLQHNLNEVFTGGISSYSLILMCISFLQLHPRQNFKNVNLGLLLLEFLELYGRNFNYMTTGISIKNGGRHVTKEVLQKELNGDLLRPSILCIEDPLTPGNDVGKSSHGALQVKQAFETAYLTLCQAVAPKNTQLNDCNAQSILGRVIKVSHEVISFRKWLQRSVMKNVTKEKIADRRLKWEANINASRSSSSSDDVSEFNNSHDKSSLSNKT
ncbi:non-canonical poly(A) RNA polymerase protein Trf4-1-like [Chironomus tepperi]|uniref:non-canonical poly(A) RNA polymerase protein Trf4-1-like n=1 Tax=Chironomus tepperi TaxID=113505 RepID=UPI00391F0C6B